MFSLTLSLSPHPYTPFIQKQSTPLTNLLGDVGDEFHKKNRPQKKP